MSTTGRTIAEQVLAALGTSSTVVIEGPAGIGKTTLLGRVAELWAEGGGSVHRAAASDTARRVPWRRSPGSWSGRPSVSPEPSTTSVVSTG